MHARRSTKLNKTAADQKKEWQKHGKWQTGKEKVRKNGRGGGEGGSKTGERGARFLPKHDNRLSNLYQGWNGGKEGNEEFPGSNR